MCTENVSNTLLKYSVSVTHIIEATFPTSHIHQQSYCGLVGKTHLLWNTEDMGSILGTGRCILAWMTT